MLKILILCFLIHNFVSEKGSTRLLKRKNEKNGQRENMVTKVSPGSTPWWYQTTSSSPLYKGDYTFALS